MIGLKKDTVKLYPHETEWETEAQDTIMRLKKVLGAVIKDIQHIGSTAITSIKAKPIIDIALAVDSFGSVLEFEQELKDNGFYYVRNNLNGQLLFTCGSYYEGTGDLQTHFIHVVLTNSMEWINYIIFRDYLISNLKIAKEYEAIKISLAENLPDDIGRKKYSEGKHDFIVYTLRKALVSSYLDKTVNIKIDRPIGSTHPKHADLMYPINYGYIPNIIGGDGEELDVYLLGISVPVKEYTAHIIGIVHRRNDVEDKLVAAPSDMRFKEAEIAEAVHFQEQYYDVEIEVSKAD